MTRAVTCSTRCCSHRRETRSSHWITHCDNGDTLLLVRPRRVFPALLFPQMPQDFFKDVFYYISETLPLDQRDQLSEVLDDRGGHPVSVTDSQLTHFIAASLPLEEFVESPPEDIPIVTPFWVERSAILESPQDPEYYSADPAFLFSGIVAAATDLSKSDCELISAAVTALGGQWRTALTRDVTHLFALAPGSAKYETAMHYREKSGIRVLVPHWFDDTVRLGIRDLPTRNYEWPEPRVFQQRPEGRTREEDEEYEPPPERMVLYDTASLDNDEQRKVRPAARKVWKGMKLLLGLSLDLSDHQRKALSADIRRQGGEVVEFSSAKSKAHERAKEELANLEEADIFVTRFRTGSAYAKVSFAAVVCALYACPLTRSIEGVPEKEDDWHSSMVMVRARNRHAHPTGRPAAALPYPRQTRGRLR